MNRLRFASPALLLVGLAVLTSAACAPMQSSQVPFAVTERSVVHSPAQPKTGDPFKWKGKSWTPQALPLPQVTYRPRGGR
jgi:hypothetical protein